MSVAISHICTGCGTDLARERAGPEPHYGLWIVECPGCGGVAVRRRHRQLANRRRARRWRTAIWSLAGRVLLLTLATVAVLIASSILAETLQRVGLRWGDGFDILTGRTPWPGEDWEYTGASFVAIGWVLACVTAGAVLGAGLAHWRWWAAWGAWAGLLLMLVWIVPAWQHAHAAFSTFMDPTGAYGTPRNVLWSRLAASALSAALLAGAGLPIGRLIHRSNVGAAAGRRRRMLAKHRRWRLAR